MRKYLLVLSACLFSLLAGCGGNKELDSFQEGINNFYIEVSNIENSMDSIDSNESDAVTILLTCMEQMKTQFQTLAETEVPMEFASVEELADDAYFYMSEAVRLYTEAYEDDVVNDSYVQAAVENYESAMKRVNYIAVLLQGEIPEGATIIEGEGNEFEPYAEEEE